MLVSLVVLSTTALLFAGCDDGDGVVFIVMLSLALAKRVASAGFECTRFWISWFEDCANVAMACSKL